ncbi:hypothetical protein BU23DRAFT_190464 [Bimuria novae-zelandiae CBS 107.79]|uniref:Uncharacterized protein n=1 Tax=Bimuria novae-zelandiae CBS 107.79 TaxID=1447943 RepID=A0A6A5W0J0_9PLEO|nr:hypothetical protein BU23DRAFT_190464 [Bimuria novae-zelandiae CBS 107.79]
MAVQDPTFWKRFSVAIHQDEAAKEGMAQDPNLKHSYVISLAELQPPAAATPTSPSERPSSPYILFPQSPAAHALSQPTSPILATSPGSATLKKAQTPPRAHVNPFGRHGNASQMTLGLSGRPQSRFKFWTSVSADPSNRDSWLEGQRRKRRHRTWVCWGFWVCLLLLVGGIVATILVLKSKDII